MFKKIFKAVLIIIISLIILSVLWDVPLLGLAIKVVISAGLVSWCGYTLWNFKDND